MRKVLLAATAVAGMTGLVAGQAHAQMADQPLTTSSFGTTASGGQPAPSTLTVRLKAALWVEGSYATDSLQHIGTSKDTGVLLGSYMRLYPSFDGVTANGIQYGATTEIRMNTGGAGGLGNAGTGSSSNPGSALYMRRGNGYIGTPTLGRLFFGPENNAIARNAAGSTMEDFDYNGGFNGDFGTGARSAPTSFAFMRTSSQYTANKLVYMTPAFSGFTLGLSWTPSYSTGDSNCAFAGQAANCAQLSSFAGGSTSPKNEWDVSVGYKGSFGPVALTAFAGYQGSGKVMNTTASAASPQFKALSIVAAGGRVTINGVGPGAIGIGGQVNTGQQNFNLLERQGQRNGTNVVAGIQYTIGTVIFGFQYINTMNPGTLNPANTRSMDHDMGYALGGAWDWAPGATLYGDIAYFTRRQAGYNFATASNGADHNTYQGRAIQIGNVFRW